MILLAILLIKAPIVFTCDYSYAAGINEEIKDATMPVRADTKEAAEDYVKRVVEGKGYILEGVECKK